MKANILAAKTVARTLRSSLGPKGMDKMLQSPDGDVTISKQLSIYMHSQYLQVWLPGNTTFEAFQQSLSKLLQNPLPREDNVRYHDN